MTIRRVAVFTGSRAEYGLLVPLIRMIEQADDFELQLIVSGSHLSELHGATRDEILRDGFVPAAEIEMLLATDSPVATLKGMGLAMIDLGRDIARLQPDYLVVLGDRYEVVAAAFAGVVSRVPVVHLHGGEASHGSLDDTFRHAVTKLASLHFVAAPEFRRRVIQMGEDEQRVFLTAPAVQDRLDSITYLSRAELADQLGNCGDQPFALVAYHPASSVDEDAQAIVQGILRGIAQAEVSHVLVSMPNADPHFVDIRRAWEQEVPDGLQVTFFENVGQRVFLSLLREAAMIVGNSSSGIIEAPLVRTPTVNVGSRQEGRPRADSVIDAGTDAAAISFACSRAVAGGFQFASPYGAGASMADSVVRALRETDPVDLAPKVFVDLAIGGSDNTVSS